MGGLRLGAHQRPISDATLVLTYNFPHNTFRNNCHQFGFTTEVLERAAELLAASTEWQRYLHLLDTGDSIDDIKVTSNRWPGSFSTVARLQQQTMTVEGIHDRDRTQLTAGGTRTGRRRGHSNARGV